MINNSTHGKKQFSVHLLNSTSFGHEARFTNRYSHEQNF